jgi:hypothetical protein
MKMITSREEFDKYIAGMNKDDELLSRVAKEDIRFFRQNLNFENGKLISAFWGDFVQKYNFSEEEVAKIFCLFGVSPEQFKAKEHWFGDGAGNCLPRPYFFCGYAKKQ